MKTSLNSYMTGPDAKGFFDIYGGKFVAETLMPLINELEKAYIKAKADKKSSRNASEGCVVCKLDADKNEAVLLEINSETDFAANDENFKEALRLLKYEVLGFSLIKRVN